MCLFLLSLSLSPLYFPPFNKNINSFVSSASPVLQLLCPVYLYLFAVSRFNVVGEAVEGKIHSHRCITATPAHNCKN